MSYDLVIFDAEDAPRDLASFEAWYSEVAEADAELATVSDSAASEQMRDFCSEMEWEFPNIAKLPGGAIEEGQKVASYDFGSKFILIHFPWSVSDAAGQTALRLAQKYGLGLSDLNGVVVFPDEDPFAASKADVPQSLLSKIKNFLGFKA